MILLFVLAFPNSHISLDCFRFLLSLVGKVFVSVPSHCVSGWFPFRKYSVISSEFNHFHHGLDTRAVINGVLNEIISILE